MVGELRVDLVLEEGGRLVAPADLGVGEAEYRAEARDARIVLDDVLDRRQQLAEFSALTLDHRDGAEVDRSRVALAPAYLEGFVGEGGRRLEVAAGVCQNRPETLGAVEHVRVESGVLVDDLDQAFGLAERR